MIEEIHIEDRADATAIAGLMTAVVGEDPLLGHAPFFQEVVLRDAAVNVIPRFAFIEIANARCVLVGIDTAFPEAVHPDVEVEKFRPAVIGAAFFPCGIDRRRELAVAAREDGFDIAGLRIMVGVLDMAVCEKALQILLFALDLLYTASTGKA